MINFFASTLSITALLPFYLQWGSARIEGQIDRMQEAVFNSPGTEAPIPPAVLIGGAALAATHLVLARRLFKLTPIQIILALVLGSVTGFWGWQQWRKVQP